MTLMLIAQDRSGNTSLKKSPKRIPFNPHEDSTVPIDVDPSYFKVTTEAWKIGEKDQATNKEAKISFENNLARQVVKNLAHEGLPMSDTEAHSLSVSERNEVKGDPPDISSTERDDPLSPKKTLKAARVREGK